MDSENTTESFEFHRNEDIKDLSDINGTVIVPKSDGTFPAPLLSRVTSRIDDRGGSKDIEIPLFNEKEDDIYEIDLEGLARIIWEHRQYSQAQGFSPRHLEILRAIQEISEENSGGPVAYDDIKKHADFEVKTPTLSTSIRKLEERNLIRRWKNTSAVIFQGFDNWVPNPEGDEE